MKNTSILITLFSLLLSTFSCQKADIIDEEDPLARYEANGFPVSIPEDVVHDLLAKKHGSLASLPRQEINRLARELIFSRHENVGVQTRTDQYTLRTIIHINGSQYDYDQVCCQVGLPSTYVKAEVIAYPAEGQDLDIYSEVLMNGSQLVYAHDEEFDASCPEGEDLYIKGRARLFSTGSYDVDSNITCRD